MSGPLILAVGDHRIALDIAGDGRAVSWRVGDTELLGGRSADPVEHGMYAMGPWAGRIAGNAVRYDGRVLPMPATYGDWALHGTVVGSACRVVSQEHGEGRARAVVDVDLGASWPWPGTLRAGWEVTDDAVRTRLELHALEAPFPGVVGWHPWFRRVIDGASARWALDAALLAERGDDFRLTGRLGPIDREQGTFDDAFRTARTARIAWPGLLSIDIESSHPWFVVFDMLPDLLCLEPQSGPPNGVNDGLGDAIAIARPGQPIVLLTQWRISRAPQRD